MRMYKVAAKCGHVGRRYYALKIFPVRASNGREAAEIVRGLPRVKHHHKDAIISVTEIDHDEYRALIEKNEEDPYFHCGNVQEQRMYEETLFLELIIEKHMREKSNRIIYSGKELIRNPKRYIKNTSYIERYAV